MEVGRERERRGLKEGREVKTHKIDTYEHARVDRWQQPT